MNVPRDRSAIAIGLAGLAAVVLLAVAALSGAGDETEPTSAPAAGSRRTTAPAAVATSAGSRPTPAPVPSSSLPSSSLPISSPTAASTPPGPPAVLPNGGRKVFADGDLLVAYYGTAGTGVLGVLGETHPDQADRRLRAAAQPFRRPGHRVQRVYELIVTVADRGPGDDGDFSHDIDRAKVQAYIDAAHRNGALLLLDLQPGRSDFLTVARRWEWALTDPWVGLALDPEWRMGPRQVPGRTLGHVGAREVNQTSAWLARLRLDRRLPQKLFVLHQFRTSMIQRIDAVQPRSGLAEVQHVDGFGTRGQKLATYAAVARPDRFAMGFKLFYDEDVDRMGAPQVRAIRPRVRFVSFQ